MRYFLDFDRTIFDTDRFKSEYAEKLSTSDVAFEPGELSGYVFADAAQFLRDKENAVTIITFGERELQEKKVKSALYGIPRMSVMYTEEVRKGCFLEPHTHLHEGALLVDDSPEELAELEARCAKLALYEMRRDNASGDGRWPTIRSLAELP